MKPPTPAAPTAPASPLMTRRQEQVYDLYKCGLRQGEIAARLSITPRTVRKHLDDGADRLGVVSHIWAAIELELRRHGIRRGSSFDTMTGRASVLSSPTYEAPKTC